MNVRRTTVSLPELALVAGTRALLGGGVALLFADRLADKPRKAMGWTLLAIGVMSTIPLAIEIFGGHRLEAKDEEELAA